MIIKKDVIRNILPHGENFIFVDSVEIFSDTKAIGYKTVREDEPWVPHHFPSKPIYPGFYMLESIGQTAAVLMGHLENSKSKEKNIHDFKGLTSAEHVKFKRPILVGEIMRIEVDIIRGSKRWPLWTASGKILVEESVACIAQITVAFVES